MKKSPFFDTQNNINTNPNQHNVNHNNTNTSLPSIPTHSSQLPSAYSVQQQQQYFAAYAAQRQYRLQQQASRQRKLSQSRNNNALSKPSSTIHKNNNPIYSQRYLLDLMGNANMNGTATPQQYYTNHTDNAPQPPPQSHIAVTQQPESTINLNQNRRHSPSTKILQYDDILSEMRPNDLMQFDEEWTQEFPKQNSIEATNWFTKAADIWKVVDDDRLKRNVHNGFDNMLYSDGDKNEKLATPTNQHHDHHQSESDHARDSEIELKAKKHRKKSKTKGRSKKKKKKKSKKSHSSLSSSSSSAKKTTKKSKKSRKKKKKKKSKKSRKKKKKSKKKDVKTPKKRGRKKGQTKKKMLEMSQQNEDRKKTKTMWIYKKILDPMIDGIYWEKLPCPARQNDFKHLQPDELLPNCFDTTPPAPIWLHHFVYHDIANNNNHENSNNAAPKQEKTLQDEWIGDALMIYDFLFRFKKLLRMNDTFTISEWIDCVRRKHETYLMNFVLSIFVAIIMNKSELKMKERSELLNGYKCSLLTWPSLLLDFLNIRKRNMLVDDRTKQYAFNDIIKVINRNKPAVNVNDDNDNNAKSTPFFNEISCDRKIELLTMMMQHIVGETKLFKYEFQTLITEMDKYRQQYLQHRDEECKRVRADAKNEDKVMRGLHRSIPVHWTDFDIICKANQRNDSVDEDFMEQFYGKLFHSMSLEGANKGKVSQTEIEKYKTKLFVLIKLKNELQKAGEITDCPPPINLSKTDPQSKVIKEKWRGKVQANVEKIFDKYINDFVIVPETKIFAQNRKEMVHVMVLNYNKTSALSLGLDRYNNRYWILADDFSKIIVENTDENQWGYFDKNAQLQELILFLNDSGRNEATLKINLLEKGINYRVDNSVSTEWNLTAWLSDNRHSQWICYPNWRYVLRYQIQQTNFYQFISKDSSKNAAYQQIMLGRNSNNGNDMNDNVPFQMSVIKHFLLDLQWSLHLCCSEESLKARELFRRDLQNEYVSIHKLAEFAWRLFRSIDGLWRKKWLNVKALKQKLMQNDDENPRTYSKIMLCLYVIDAAIFYQESEYLTQNKNNTKKRRSKLEERMMKLQVDYNKNNFDAQKEKPNSQLLCDVNMSFSANAPRKRGRKQNSMNKHKTINTPTTIKRGRIVQKEEKKNYDLESSQSDSNSSSNSHASDSELESSSDSSAASSDSLPPRKKTKRGRPRKNAILETLKNTTKTKTKSKSKRYTGARTNLTLICSKCVLAEDQNAIIKCSSCHGGYHTYCMEDETSWDPKNNDGEFFCHECIGAQISHLSTRRSHRLQKKAPSKALAKSAVKSNKNEIDEFESISEFEKAPFEKSASDQESGHEDEEEDESECGVINRKRKRKINNRFEDTSSSEDGNECVLNAEPSTKKRKLRANESGNDGNQSVNKINDNDLRIPKRTTITKRSDNGRDNNNNRNKYELPKFNITNNINVNQTNINQIMVNNNINNQNEDKPKQSQPSQPSSKSSKSSYSNSRSANKKYESYSSSSHSSTSHSRHRNDRNYKYGGHNDGEYRRSGTRNMERNVDAKYDSYHHRESRERHNKYRDRDRSYKQKHKHRDRDRDRERSSHRRDRDRDNRDNKDRNRVKRYQRRRDHTNNGNNNQRSRHRKCNNYYTYSSDDNDDMNDSDYRP